MSTTTNKQRLFQQLCSAVPKYGKAGEPVTRPVLEQFLYAICREDVTRELADRAFRNLREHYFDWNEVRVSSPRELAESLDCLPDAEGRIRVRVSDRTPPRLPVDSEPNRPATVSILRRR